MKLTITLLLLFLAVGCMSTSTLYFASPEEAVKKSQPLLVSKNWQELSACYDLSASDIEVGSLEDGSFFYTNERPDMAHPAGFWHYKHPFHPDFNYSRHESGEQENTVVVQVEVRISQGADLPEQIGLHTFGLKKPDKGYQFLPGYFQFKPLAIPASPDN